MFDLNALFQNVLASLQDGFAAAIVNFITSLVGGILPGLFGN